MPRLRLSLIAVIFTGAAIVTASVAQLPQGPGSLSGVIDKLPTDQKILVTADGRTFDLGAKGFEIPDAAIGHEVVIGNPKYEHPFELEGFDLLKLKSVDDLASLFAKGKPASDALTAIRNANDLLNRKTVMAGSDIFSAQENAAFDLYLSATSQFLMAAANSTENASVSDEDKATVLIANMLFQRGVDRSKTSSSKDKTIYGFDDNIQLYRLGKIAQQAKSVAAIRRRGMTDTFCTGFLVSPDLLLTANHCLTGQHADATRLEVVFDLVDIQSGQTQQEEVRPVKGKLPYASTAKGPLTDLVLLELSAPAPAERAPLCLHMDDAARNASVYAFGFPLNGPMKFHGNGRVYLPYSVGADDYKDFYRVVAAHEVAEIFRNLEFDEIRSIAEAGKVLLQLLSSHLDERLNVLDQLYVSHSVAASYGPSTSGTRYLMEAPRADRGVRSSADARPVFAASLDLSSGDSGAPVLLMESVQQCVVGMLKFGAGEVSGRDVTIDAHEAVIPASVLLYDIGRTYGAAVKNRLIVF